MKQYRLYARFEGDKNYKAIDINSGLMVNSLDDSTLLDENDCHRFREFIVEFGEKFPNLEFDIRQVKEKKEKVKELVKVAKEPLPNNLNDLFEYMQNNFDEYKILSMFKEVYSDEIEEDLGERLDKEIDDKIKEITQDEEKDGVIKIKVSSLIDRMKLEEFITTQLFPNYSDQISNLFEYQSNY